MHHIRYLEFCCGFFFGGISGDVSITSKKSFRTFENVTEILIMSYTVILFESCPNTVTRIIWSVSKIMIILLRPSTLSIRSCTPFPSWSAGSVKHDPLPCKGNKFWFTSVPNCLLSSSDHHLSWETGDRTSTKKTMSPKHFSREVFTKPQTCVRQKVRALH